MKRTGVYLIIVALLAAATSCTGGSAVTTEADSVTSAAEQAFTSSHQLWGMWQFIADPHAKTLDIIQMHSADFHLNALPFLEPPALVNLTLESLKFNGNIIEADIGLKHPFTGHTEFTGFDVCGILITNGNTTGFNDPALRMAGAGDTRLLNPDGYSRWWNPAEFPHGATISTYKDGLLGTPDAVADYNSTLNAYKYFCDDLGANDPLASVTLAKRGMFSAGKKNIRHYTIDMGTGLVFNYAVDACWAPPSGGSPWTAPDDFPPAANRAEAYRIVVTEVSNTLWNDGTANGGGLSLSINVYDWFNALLNTVMVESPGNFAPAASSTPVGTGMGFSTYEINISNATPGPGSINLLISIASDTVGYGGVLPGKPVTAYFTHTVTVAAEAPKKSGWARTWGWISADRGRSTVVDSAGNIYVTGSYSDTVDFDPGPGEDWHTANGTSGWDSFLCRYDSAGTLIWAKTWGGNAVDEGSSVAVDKAGNVYVTGYFQQAADFDPGIGVDWHTPVGDLDIFMSKFDSTGGFIWAKTWGGSEGDFGTCVAVDASGNIYISGSFRGNVDFDPGAGEDWRKAKGSCDAFLSKFNSSGVLLWAKTWGGDLSDECYGVAVDSSGYIYAGGHFWDKVDLDPNAGEDWHTSVAVGDVSLSKFDSSGAFLWAKTWGGGNWDQGLGVAVDGSGNAYISGYFSDSVDFDPGPGEDWHKSNGDRSVYVSKFASSGAFLWARTWGGSGTDFSWGVAVDGVDNVYVTGFFSGDVDFDPGPSEDWHSSNGEFDVFLSKLAPSGAFLWANTWGGISYDECYNIAVDGLNNAYVTGYYEEAVDFEPGPGEDWHTSNGSYDAFLCKFLPDGSW